VGRILAGLRIECVKGDITKQEDIDAVANAANAQLLPGGGVAGAIHRAAGTDLNEECRALAPIKPGEAVMTGAYGLPNRYVIHCLGPVYARDEPSDVLLASCYRSALRLAEARELASVAFPALSTGAFGYPLREAAEVALGTVAEESATLDSVQLVRFILYDDEALGVHEEVLTALVS
jgi:O-acetyl-ADP-ribose deacetylase (regulator of RNase III)